MWEKTYDVYVFYAIVLRLINSLLSLKKITFVMVFGNLISVRIHLSDLISPFSPYFQLRGYIKRSLFYFIYKHLDIRQK